MVLQIDTIVGNKKPSKKLAGLLEDLANTVYLSYKDIEMKMEKIRAQAQAEDFSKQETIGLIKQYLKKISLTNNQIKWLTYLKPRIKEQKKRREEQVVNYTGANMSIAKPEPEPETASIPVRKFILSMVQMSHFAIVSVIIWLRHSLKIFAIWFVKNRRLYFISWEDLNRGFSGASGFRSDITSINGFNSHID